jgi:hypothetical protein
VRYLFSAAEKRVLHRLNAVLYSQSALRLHRRLYLYFDLNRDGPIGEPDHDRQPYFQVYSRIVNIYTIQARGAGETV